MDSQVTILSNVANDCIKQMIWHVNAPLLDGFLVEIYQHNRFVKILISS